MEQYTHTRLDSNTHVDNQHERNTAYVCIYIHSNEMEWYHITKDDYDMDKNTLTFLFSSTALKCCCCAATLCVKKVCFTSILFYYYIINTYVMPCHIAPIPLTNSPTVPSSHHVSSVLLLYFSNPFYITFACTPDPFSRTCITWAKCRSNWGSLSLFYFFIFYLAHSI